MANFPFALQGRRYRCLLAVLLSIFILPLYGQLNWYHHEVAALPMYGERRIEPEEARLLTVNPDSLRTLLWAAPHERTTKAEESPLLLPIPTPSGEVATFRIVAYDISEAEGLANFPDIRTWYGINTDGSGQSIFLDWTARGFHASVRYGDSPAYFIDPVFRGRQGWYQSYFIEDAVDDADEAFSCETATDDLHTNNTPGGAGQGRSTTISDCNLRSYRMAIAATAEYSNYFGATSPAQANLVHSAIVTTLNRVNQIFTRDLTLRLLLVANNQDVYYYDPSSDPYTGTAILSLLWENTANLNSVLGADAYDLGHVFSAGFNSGVAYLSSSCGSNKGGGVTSRSTPEGDPFDVDYVSHEIGHQVGARHTQNNSCNYSYLSGMEPGSGSTIMSYAGICSPNIQANSDAYFHGRSIEEIAIHLEIGAGSGCSAIVDMSLGTPNISPIGDKTIPHSTPFRLSAQVSGNGNLAYSWEQIDAEQAPMPPRANNTEGPLFRSLFPSSNPERYFPKLADMAAAAGSTWEVLPSVSRALNLRMTARNYNATYGCAAQEDVLLTVDGDRPAFRITDPSQGNQLSAGQLAQVQWDVAQTDQAPINSQLVEILFSADGGDNFTLLASNEPNDGLATVSLPNQMTNDALIMVRSMDNIFFNVSSQPFRILGNSGAPEVGINSLGATTASDCFSSETAATFSFITSSTGGATAPITFSVNDLPAPATAVFYPNPVQPGGTTTLTIDKLDQITSGTYTISANGSSADDNVSIPVVIEKIAGANDAAPAIDGPAMDEFEVDIRPKLAVRDVGSETYEFQLSDSPSFNNLILDTLTNSNVCPLKQYLEANTTYYWRSRATSSYCGQSEWANSFFTTGECHIYRSTDSPQIISSGPPPNQVVMSIDVPQTGKVLDVDIYQLDISHTYVEDLSVRLVSPDEYSSLLINQHCGDMDDLRISLDDEADRAYSCPASDPNLFVRPPNADLSSFDDKEINGNWRLEVNDLVNSDGGSLNGFALKLCVSEFSLLPVSWLSFDVRPETNQLALFWETAEEVNNTGFYVERSLGLSRQDATWKELGFVAAVGNEQGGAYSFIDDSAEKGQAYFYRLRQVDADGTFDYSPIRSGQLNGDVDAASLQVFPNPSSDFFHYRWLSDKPSSLAYELTDIRGLSYQKGTLLSSGGSLSLRSLPTGVYILRTEDGQVHRLLKQ